MAFVRKINVSTKVFLRRLPGVEEARRGREGTGGMGETGETEEREGGNVKRMGRTARDRGKGRSECEEENGKDDKGQRKGSDRRGGEGQLVDGWVERRANSLSRPHISSLHVFEKPLRVYF